MMYALWKTVWQFLKMLNMQLSHEPAILIGLDKKKTSVHTKTCTRVFIAPLFIIVKMWEKTNVHPPNGETKYSIQCNII